MSFRLNVSAILTYQRCPTDWYYRYVLRRVPRLTAHYFESGNFWHALMSLAAQNGLPSAIATAPGLVTEMLDKASADPDCSAENFQKLRDELERLSLLLSHVRDDFLVTDTIAIEKPLEAAIPPFDKQVSVFGRPDRIRTKKDRIWHVQYKSLSDRTALGPYCAATERSLHELVYAYLICGAYGYSLSDYGGTDLRIVRKLSRKAIATTPQAAFVEELIPIRESEVLNALDDVAAIAEDMQAILAGTRRLVQNRQADLNRFGSALSPYWEARCGRVSIHDDRHYRTLPPDEYESGSTTDTE